MMECCKTCRHWEFTERQDEYCLAWGNCYGMCQPYSKVNGAHNIETLEDFCCNHYEAKEDAKK